MEQEQIKKMTKQKIVKKKEYPSYPCISVHKDDIQLKAKQDYKIKIPDDVADSLACEVSRRFELNYDFDTAIEIVIEEYIEDEKDEEDEE